MEFESSEKFKNPKRPKIVHKSIQTCFEQVLGRFFWKSFFAQCSMESSKIFEKSQIFQKSKNAQNCSQFCRNLLWTCFGAIFPKNSFAQCSMDGRAFENFQNNQKNNKIQKLLLIVSKSVQTCFEHALGRFFGFFCPVIHAGLFRFSGLKIKSSVFRNSTQQRFFLHSRHSQYTQFHFRFSGLIIKSSDSPN